jgi:hypothetical protein
MLGIMIIKEKNQIERQDNVQYVEYVRVSAHILTMTRLLKPSRTSRGPTDSNKE